MLTKIKASFHCCHDIQKQHGCKIKNKYEFLFDFFDFYNEMQNNIDAVSLEILFGITKVLQQLQVHKIVNNIDV